MHAVVVGVVSVVVLDVTHVDGQLGYVDRKAISIHPSNQVVASQQLEEEDAQAAPPQGSVGRRSVKAGVQRSMVIQ